METVNQEKIDERTFTQDELNQIVEDRLQRERQKYAGMADYDQLKEKAGKYDELQEASKTELQKATERADALQKELDVMKHDAAVRAVRSKVAEEKGVPASLLTADTEEACKEQADAILAFAKPSAYPAVRDGGEVTHISKLSTRQQFAEWASQAFG